MHEVPVRAPPLTEEILRAMVGWSVLQECPDFGLSLLVAFYGLLRTGELLSLQSWHIHMTAPNSPAVVNLGLTKSGKRQGAAESITLTEQKVLQLLWNWKQRVSPASFLTSKPHTWRAMFADCLTKLKLAQWEFRPYSLRRGGATHLFIKCGSLDRVLLAGRWTAIKTAKIYLNSGLAMLADIQVPKKLLSPFHPLFQQMFSQPPLERTRTASRTGGRGKKRKASKRREGAPKSFPFFVLICFDGRCLELS